MKDRCLSRDRGELSLKAGQVDAASAADVEDFSLPARSRWEIPQRDTGVWKIFIEAISSFPAAPCGLAKAGSFLENFIVALLS